MITYPNKISHLAGFAPPRNQEPQPVGTQSVAPPQDLADATEELAIAPPKPCPSPPDAPNTAAGNSTRQVVVVRGATDLAPWVTAWQNLADHACEPNVFYEPWMLLPALEAFSPSPVPEFYLVFAPGRGPDSSKPQLCGLFPLVRARVYKGVRTTVLKSWKHLYCALCTPLLRRGQEDETLVALLDFLAIQRKGATLLELQYVSGDGPFGRTLVEVFDQRGTTTFIDESWTRAFLRPQIGKSGEEYLKGAMTGKRRKEFRRKENRLADEGSVEYAELENEADPDAALESYINDFLRLEASGWKGESGSAFACDPTHREFFRTIVTQAHQRGRLMMGTLRVGGHAIASKCDLMAGTGGFAFKIGFDEQFARFSPGVLLEMEAIRQLHEKSVVRWMDSCAVRNHPMINRLWLERRTLQTVVMATGRGRGEFVVAGLSLLRHFKRILRRTQKQKHAARSNP